MRSNVGGRARAWRAGGALCALVSFGVVGIACNDKAAPQRSAPATVTEQDNSGGSGVRAKGEEGSMGNGPSGARGGSYAATATAAPPPAASAATNGAPADHGGQGYAARPRPASPAMKGAPAADPLAFAGGGKMGGDGFAAVAPEAPKLDPNARYATTYRPGGAALAAFDSAVARGSIPASYKDLVGDFGGRYAPAMDKPKDAALAFRVEAERAQIAPAGGFLNLRIATRSSDRMPGRAPLSVHLVLDVSGSMSGAAIDNAKKAAQSLVERLEPADDFSMVTFSSDAAVLVSDGPIGPRKAQVIAKIGGVKADGGTNISAGLDLGYAQAHTPSINADAVRIVMLLSDGHANAGETTQHALASRSERAFQDGIQTSTFGLGQDFDAQLMSSIADRGAGGYYYLADSTQIAPALGRELDARLVPVAQAVEVRLRLRPDVAPIKVFGSRVLDGAEAAAVRRQEVAVDQQAQRRDGIKQDRKDDAEGGMRFFMPAFARDDRHAMLVTLQLPPGVGERAIGSVEIKYKDRLQKKNVTEEIAVRTKYAENEAASAASINASVSATAQAFTAGDAILQAASLVDVGNRPAAARLLNERAELLKAASKKLEQPALADDALRLARLANAVDGSERVQDALPLAVMLRGSGYGYLR
jgi:Ca-activated chloride channel family protein